MYMFNVAMRYNVVRDGVFPLGFRVVRCCGVCRRIAVFCSQHPIPSVLGSLPEPGHSLRFFEPLVFKRGYFFPFCHPGQNLSAVSRISRVSIVSLETV